MNDLKEQYVSLYQSELSDFTQKIINRIHGTEIRHLSVLIKESAERMYEISNAPLDIESAFNPEHAAEQGEFNRDANREDGVPF